MIIINIIKIILQYAAAACLRCYATNRTEVSDHIIICAVLAFILASGVQGKDQGIEKGEGAFPNKSCIP